MATISEKTGLSALPSPFEPQSVRELEHGWYFEDKQGERYVVANNSAAVKLDPDDDISTALATAISGTTPF